MNISFWRKISDQTFVQLLQQIFERNIIIIFTEL